MEEIRSELLNLFDGDEAYVNEFLQDVNEKNAMALLRVARSLLVNRSTATEEVEVEAVAEVEAVVEEESVETEETVEEETVAEAVEDAGDTEVEEEGEAVAEDATVEEDVVNYELGAEFVNDLVGSQEFRSVLTAAISEEFAKFSTAFEERMRSVETAVEEEKEWIQDVPKRTKRAIVSYRPRAVKSEENGGVARPESYESIAAETVANIFGD